MRIGLLIYDSLDTVSGGYLYDRMLVNHLQNSGDTVEIISLPKRKYPLLLSDNISIALYSQLKNLKIDILLQDELTHASLFLVNNYLRQKARFPIVTIVHHLRCMEDHPTYEKHLYRWVEKRYLASVGGYVFNSENTRQTVYNINPQSRSYPFTIAPPAADHLRISIEPRDIQARVLNAELFSIVFIGNLIPRKGLDTIIKALAYIQDDDWQLKIIGDVNVAPAYTRKVIKLVHRHKLRSKVSLLGKISDGELINELTNAHLLVVPSSFEGFGIVYLEAFGFGVPAIATTAGAAKEIITHGENGFLISPNDPQMLGKSIILLMRDRQRLLQMSLNARKRFIIHHSWDDTGEKTRDFLESLI